MAVFTPPMVPPPIVFVPKAPQSPPPMTRDPTQTPIQPALKTGTYQPTPYQETTQDKVAWFGIVFGILLLTGVGLMVLSNLHNRRCS